jgi:hypothetical protein
MSNGGEEMNIDMSNRETGQNRQEWQRETETNKSQWTWDTETNKPHATEMWILRALLAIMLHLTSYAGVMRGKLKVDSRVQEINTQATLEETESHRGDLLSVPR